MTCTVLHKKTATINDLLSKNYSYRLCNIQIYINLVERHVIKIISKIMLMDKKKSDCNQKMPAEFFLLVLSNKHDKTSTCLMQ